MTKPSSTANPVASTPKTPAARSPSTKKPSAGAKRRANRKSPTVAATAAATRSAVCQRFTAAVGDGSHASRHRGARAFGVNHPIGRGGGCRHSASLHPVDAGSRHDARRGEARTLDVVEQELRTPGAAGVAGLVFAALFCTSLILLYRQPRHQTAAEIAAWYFRNH